MSNTNIEKNLKNLLKDSTCNPERVLYTITNNKGYGGFHLVNIVKNKNNILQIKNRTNIRKRSLKGALSTLGAGKDGTVYIGCLDQACKRMIAIKTAKEGLIIRADCREENKKNKKEEEEKEKEEDEKEEEEEDDCREDEKEDEKEEYKEYE